MALKKKENRIRKWLTGFQEKRRIVVLDFDSFEERRNYTTSKFSIFILFTFTAIVSSLIIFLLISSTPLKKLIPGYPNPIEQKALLDKNIALDQKLNELIIKTEKEEKYLNNVQQILNGTVPSNDQDTSLEKFKSVKSNQKDEISSSEKSLREKVTNREKYDLDIIPGGSLKSEVLPELLLFPPINGEITNEMNISSGHFGVDVIAPKNEAVVAILKGTVIYQNWSPTDGHVIHIQHKKNTSKV